MSSPNSHTAGMLILKDGSVFAGQLRGAELERGEVAAGEVVFNTSLTGYQEIITDPSYAGQIIAFTYTHIGNYGTTVADNESDFVACRGVIVRDLARRHSNWRAVMSLEEMLSASGTAILSGVDTRRLTRQIRDYGAMVGAFGHAADEEIIRQVVGEEKGTEGVDLVAQVSCREPYLWPTAAGVAGGAADTKRAGAAGDGAYKVVAVDFGIKKSILAQLSGVASVEVVPASTSAADILARQPHGVFLSNGPGDPSTAPYAADTVKALLGEVPIFGICLGHQILAQALGAEVVKLPFGHHGGNHPVQNCATGEVEITAQNHNFSVADPGANSRQFSITHINLNDDTIEGLRADDAPAIGVQYHPEAAPGPHDSRYLFAQFQELMQSVHGKPA